MWGAADFLKRPSGAVPCGISQFGVYACTANIKVLAVRFGFFKAPIGSTVRAVRFRKRFGSRFIAVPLKLPLVSRFLLACHSVEPEEQSCVAFFCCASVRFAVRAIRIAVCCGSAGGGSVPAARFGSTGFLKYST